jgi:hypothetical protein
MDPWRSVLEYLASGKPQVCDLALSPYLCEFWPLAEVARYNTAYEVQTYAPGFRGFGTSGGGEMFALSPSGEVVCLPFVGMESAAAIQLAPNWPAFEAMLRAG